MPVQRSLVSSPSLPSSVARRWDPAFTVTLGALALQVIWVLGILLKIEALSSSPIFFAQLLAPMVAIILADTWRSAAKNALLITLFLPLTACLLTLLVVFVLIWKNGFTGRMTQMGTAMKIGILTWLAVIAVNGSSLLVGALVRVGWRSLWSRADH